MLMELNRRNGIMPVSDARPFYEQGVKDFPDMYLNYTFDQWLEFLKQNDLLIRHPSDILEITIRGKDFLKYLTHWGCYPDARRG